MRRARNRRGPKRRAKTDKADARHLRTLVAEGQVPLSMDSPGAGQRAADAAAGQPGLQGAGQRTVRGRAAGRSDHLGVLTGSKTGCRVLCQAGVLFIRFHAGRDRVRPADPLELRGDLLVIQVRIVTAIAADELIRVGVAAFRSAADDAGRLAP